MCDTSEETGASEVLICAECNQATDVIAGIEYYHRWWSRSSRSTEVCSDCLSDFEKCEDCGAWLAPGYNASFCPDCGQECDNCGEFCPSCDMEEVYIAGNGYSNICDSCRQNLNWCDRCEHYYNDDCECEYGPIHDYSYKPTPNFYGEGPLHLGFELEVECKDFCSPNDLSSILLDEINPTEEKFLYCKEDSSLDWGVEIVSHPMSFEWMKENEDLFDKMLKLLRRKKARSYDPHTCGMHIHMSRKAFTNLHLFKFASWLNYRVRFTTKLSQRTDDDIESWANFIPRGEVLKFVTNRMAAWRSTTVNMSNTNTVEVRMFRGSINKDAFWRKLEFVHALYVFTKQISIGDARDRDLTQFKEFLEGGKKTYPHLKEWLENKNWFDLLKQEE